MFLQQSPLSGVKLPPKIFAQGCFSHPQLKKEAKGHCVWPVPNNQPRVQCCIRNKHRAVTDDNEAIKLFWVYEREKCLPCLSKWWFCFFAFEKHSCSEGRKIGRASMYCKCTPWSSWRVWLIGRGKMDRPFETNVSCRINRAKAKVN